MSQIQGTNVAAAIAPFDTLDTYPTHDAQYGKGGYRSVATIAERDAIPTARRSEGMRVRVTTDPSPTNNTDWDWVGGVWVASPQLAAAEAARIGAETARTGAETARDSTLVNAKGATTIEDARALVADTQTFIVYTPGALTFTAYRRTSSTTQTFLGEYPAASAAILTSGNIFSTTTTVLDLYGGAIAVTVNGRVVGFTIPTGQTGATVGAGTYLGAEIASTQFREKTVRLIQRYQATVGWMNAVSPLGGVVVQSKAISTVTNLTPLSFSREQVGTEIVQICTCVVPADSVAIRQVIQVSSSNVSETSDQTIQIVGVAYQVVSGSTATQTIADNILNQRLEWINPAINAAITPVTASVNALSSRVDQNALTSGNRLGTGTSGQGNCEAFNGAVAQSSGGLFIGFSIPANAGTGNTTYLVRFIDARSLVGKTVDFIATYTTSVDFSTLCPANGNFLQVKINGVTSLVNSSNATRTILQNGTTTTVSVRYTVPANTTDIGVLYQVATTSTNQPTTRSIIIDSAYYQLVGTVEKTANDLMADQRISEALVPGSTTVSELSIKLDNAMLTSGNVLGAAINTQSNAEAFNGAVITSTSGVVSGFSIPIDDGSLTKTGINTYVTRFFNGTTLIGKTIDIIAKYTVSENFLSSCPPGTNALQVRINDVLTVVSETTVARTITQDGTNLTIKARYTVPAGTTDIGVLYQVRSTSTIQTFVRSITISSLSYQLGSDIGRTQNDVMLDKRIDVALAGALGGVVTTTSIIQAGPTRTYTTPKAANDAVIAVTSTARTEIQLDSGTYNTDPEGWTLAHYATLKGYGATTPIIHYAGADGATHADLETLWIRRDATIENLKITGQNVRYAIHAESGSPTNATKDCKVIVRNCWIEHFGNVNNTWSTQSAWGSGISSGWHVYSENNIYRAPYSAFFYHTNSDFSKPTLVENIGDTFINTGTTESGTALELQPMGTKQRDQHRLIGCEIDGRFKYNVYLWLYTTIDYQPANHCEIESSGYGNTPAVFQASDFGLALRIRTILDTGSSITVSGDAVPVIFGVARTFAGVTNIPAYVDGTVDISGVAVGISQNIFITSLGKRLGNCTSINKTLIVTVNGGAPATVVFNQDYTNVANATIIAAIQAAIGSTSVVVVDTYSPGNNYHPRLTDEERMFKNNSSTVGIPRRSIVAFDSNGKNIRLMTSSDPASVFAGVALEDIYPGTFGRVKTRGWLWLANTRTTASAGALVIGATMSVGTTPGRVDVGGTQGILKAVYTDAVEVAP